MGFSRQKYWSGLHFLLQGIFPGIETMSLTSPALAGTFFTTSTTWEGLWTVNQANWNDWPKESRKKCPKRVIQTAMRGRLSESFSLSSPLCLSTCTVLFFFFFLNKYLTCFITFQFWGILFCKAKGPGSLSLTTGLVAGIWCFRRCDPAQTLAGNPSPTSSCCLLRPPEITMP